jgi:hypothetical protein
MAKTFLGFDVSSSCVGYGVLKQHDDGRLEVVAIGHFQPVKENIFDNLLDTKTHINEILHKYRPTDIAIEDILLFIKSKSSANTITLLSMFNRTVCLCCYEFLKSTGSKNYPRLMDVKTIRETLSLDGEHVEKEDLPAILGKRLGINFPIIYNRKKNIDVKTYDQSDGMAVCLANVLLPIDSTIAPLHIPKKRKPKAEKKPRVKRVKQTTKNVVRARKRKK